MASTGKNSKQAPAESSVPVWKRPFNGMILSWNIFRRYWRIALCVVAISVFYITSRYSYITKVATVNRLEVEASATRARCLTAKGRYVERTRESRIILLVDSMNLNLTIPDNPVYKINYKN